VELVVSPDGKVWIAANRGNSIYSLDPVSAVFKEYKIPTNRSLPIGITIDPKGDVWFVEADRDANKIARFSPEPIAKDDEISLPVAEAPDKGSTAARWAATVFVVLLALGMWYIVAKRKRR
ncbi:MAG: hypothetical protein HY880_04905, partial [Deltaproteobacteria bacterium]|nr:hypothetical protein [Deltaproteobacteria bacterium]